MLPGTRFTIEVRPRLPRALARLETLASNLLYSWDRDVRGIFRRLDSNLFDACGHSPKRFLRRVSQECLDRAAADPYFVDELGRVLASVDRYLARGFAPALAGTLDPGGDLVAYFCLEFGLHESMPLYSGGLGILAGDQCKAASDLGIPFIAVGLLYRQGYFDQHIDADGNQVAHYPVTRFDELPIEPLHDAAGRELRVPVPLGDETLWLRLWQARVGHTRLLLLDADIDDNAPGLRVVTWQLYGGDARTRIAQELVLGIGGVRALRAIGAAPTVWHMNEGHAAFLVLERTRECMQDGLDFDAAFECQAAPNVFTTHTPVASGHDVFADDVARPFLQPLAHALGVDVEGVLALGRGNGHHGFNMTALALRGSRHRNGVSAVHGRTASVMERYAWPGIEPEENPVSHVTNGVHVPTFLAQEWAHLFDARFGSWRDDICQESVWRRLDDVADHRFHSIRQHLKADLLQEVRWRVEQQLRRNGLGEATVRRATALLHPSDRDVLVLGFARRFAAYKRADLVFSDVERLTAILNRERQPVLLLMAGKAHPHDQPGQDLIRRIHALASQPRLLGRVLLIEDYDMALARALVTGSDVWINTPEYPLEASGTSGQKAGANGVVNVSVLDGWWAEGYDGANGWAIGPPRRGDPQQRRAEEANDLLDILERDIIPLYFARDQHGYSEGWVRLARASMQSIIPRFNATRMVTDYVRRMYVPARDLGARLAAAGGDGARRLAQWKQHVAAAWPGVWIRRVDVPPEFVVAGDGLSIEVLVHLNGLAVEDVAVECVVAGDGAAAGAMQSFPLAAAGAGDDGGMRFAATLQGLPGGRNDYRLRAYPAHPLLNHRFEMGRMLWV
jgi:starch phosphorylase